MLADLLSLYSPIDWPQTYDTHLYFGIIVERIRNE
jgi:hypothetical protein